MKLADADWRKVARWMADRARMAAGRSARQATRLRIQIHDAMRRSPRLPPGSLSASCLRRVGTDDLFYLKQFRRHGPIFKLLWGSGHLKICVVGFALGRRMLSQHRGALRVYNHADITPVVPSEYLRMMSPAIHPKYRRLFKAAFRADLVAACEPELRDVLRRELVRLAEPEETADPTTAAKRLYATLDTIVMRALLTMVLGVRPGSPLAPALEAGCRRLGPDGYVARVGPAEIAEFHAIRDTVTQIVQSMRHGDGTPFCDSILKRLVETRPESIDETVIGNTIYMVERGRHDLRDLFRWVLKYLCDHPSVIAELRAGFADPAADLRLAEACILETLRLDQAESLSRRAIEPFTFEGLHFPKQSWVAILLREAHRDPKTFAEPDAFRPHRFLTRTYSADEYAPFGIDDHQCVAASLVIRLGALFVEELVKGFTWTVSSDGPRRFGHSHWEPSAVFAIDLRRSP